MKARGFTPREKRPEVPRKLPPPRKIQFPISHRIEVTDAGWYAIEAIPKEADLRLHSILSETAEISTVTIKVEGATQTQTFIWDQKKPLDIPCIPAHSMLNYEGDTAGVFFVL